MKRTIIVYGHCGGVIPQAIRHLTEVILEASGEHPACIPAEQYQESEALRPVFIGTRQDNPHVARISNRILTRSEEYLIRVADDIVLIEGFDDAGVLYGCIDFYAKYIAKAELTHDHHYYTDLFAGTLPDFEYSSAPATAQRGLWTWGYVINDYRGYIDNMARLKLNTLIIWNDFVPVNAKEMVEYAHASNVHIYWGYPWGWDTSCTSIDVEHIFDITDGIIQHYAQNYAHLGGDGIYFQSFTETQEEKIGGLLIADAVTEFVNHTAQLMLDAYPDLKLLFGLHAPSVRAHLDSMQRVDPRLTIIWEDCGAFPFDYIPSRVQGFDETIDFTRSILTLRGPEEKFGAVLKGFTMLDWSGFVHQHGSYYTGSATPGYARQRMDRKARIWRYVQAYWLRNAGCADEMIRLINETSGSTAVITALVEDSMFEQKLFYPVALYAAMCWGYEGDLKDMMCDVALNRFVEFA